MKFTEYMLSCITKNFLLYANGKSNFEPKFAVEFIICETKKELT